VIVSTQKTENVASEIKDDRDYLQV